MLEMVNPTVIITDTAVIENEKGICILQIPYRENTISLPVKRNAFHLGFAFTISSN